jgi:predicted metal-binding membrane protein
MMSTRTGVLSTSSALLVACSLGAWLLTVQSTAGMEPQAGTMGRGLVGFLALWTAMMAAMMLPSVAPVTSLYLRGLRAESRPVVRGARGAGLIFGYLLAWSSFGLFAYVLALSGGELADGAPTAATWVAAGALVAAGLYQLTPLKDVCLSHCRSPVGFLLHFGSLKGRVRDVRVGFLHGGYCVGCCWGLMLVLIVVGVMNLAAMVAIAAAVLIEKTWRHGKGFSIAVGMGLIVLGLVVPAHPGLVPGVHGTMTM